MPPDTNLIKKILAPARPFGLNVAAGLNRETYNQLAPPEMAMARLFESAQAVVVVGNGGGDLWRRFCHDMQTGHKDLPSHEHPLDEWLWRVASGLMSGPWREAGAVGVISSSVREARPLNFMAMAERAGLGVPGRLGILMHPQFGPWWALRLAVFLNVPLPQENSPLAASVCEGCSAPCVSACPAGVVQGPGAFDWMGCQTHRRVNADCVGRCAARLSCPVGVSFAYPPQALAYHMSKSRGCLLSQGVHQHPAIPHHSKGRKPPAP